MEMSSHPWTCRQSSERCSEPVEQAAVAGCTEVQTAELEPSMDFAVVVLVNRDLQER